MIPDGVSRQPLRFVLTEYFLVSLVFRRDSSNGCRRDFFRVEDDPSKEVSACPLLSRDVPLSGYKDGPFCVVGTQYHWELCMVDPSSFPIYFWLCGSKPWIP